MWVVEFHADGGQCCIPGRRIFSDPVEASAFAKKHRDERGHTCKNSVKEYFSEDDSLKNEGMICEEISIPLGRTHPLLPPKLSWWERLFG